jgi:hypothetical protein
MVTDDDGCAAISNKVASESMRGNENNKNQTLLQD